MIRFAPLLLVIAPSLPLPLCAQTPLKVAVMNTSFLDTSPLITNRTEIVDAFDNHLGPFLMKISHGRMELDPLHVTNDIFDVQLPKKKQGDGGYNGNARRVMQDAIGIVGANILNNYDVHVVISEVKSGGTGQPFGKVWVDSLDFHLLTQEFVHSLNVPHSSAFQLGGLVTCGGGVPTPPDYRGVSVSNVFPRGNKFDFMSSGSVYLEKAHPNVRFKHYLGWIEDVNVIEVTSSGTYAIWEQDNESPGYPAIDQPVALRIPSTSPAGGDYWVELRSQISGTVPYPGCSAVTNANQGILVYSASEDWRYLGREVGTEELEMVLLDMKSGTNPCECTPEEKHFQWTDAALVQGSAFPGGNPGPVFKGDNVEISLVPPALIVGGIRVRMVSVQFDVEPTPLNDVATIEIQKPGDTLYPSTTTLVNYEFTIQDSEGIESVFIDLESVGDAPVRTFSVCTGGCAGGLHTGSIDMVSLPKSGYSFVVRVTDTEGATTDNGSFFLYEPPLH